MESGRTTRNIIDKFAMDKGIALEPVWTSSSVSNLKELATRNMGIAVLFEMMVRDSLDEGDLIKVQVTFTAKKSFILFIEKIHGSAKRRNTFYRYVEKAQKVGERVVKGRSYYA